MKSSDRDWRTDRYVICAFRGEYSWLSNFYPATVIHEEIMYPSVEHAFQAAKTMDRSKRMRIAGLERPERAKREGRRLLLRPDWEDVKLQVMEDILRSKFNLSRHLRRALLRTGDAELIEGSSWGDTFWGRCDGEGHNHLGRLLMKIREELKDEEQDG